MNDATPAEARKTDPENTAQALAQGILAGERRALARGITLIESKRAADQAAAEALLSALLPKSGGAIRLGISGTPGVGKSSFIERFGLYLIQQGLRVAVLAIDPSSAISGGSILGDKTRMEKLARAPEAFIRPSPSAGTLGGVARRTREAMLLCEAAGFDVVLVETVGVGQSETAVAGMVDMFLLLLAPGGGDDLQGIKRGIMELADLVIVNKADGDLLIPARHAQSDYRMALHLMRPRHPGWHAEVLLASALLGQGLEEIWTAIKKFKETLEGNGAIKKLRTEQAQAWLRRELQDGLWDWLLTDSKIAAALPALEKQVGEGRLAPAAAARQLLAMLKA